MEMNMYGTRLERTRTRPREADEKLKAFPGTWIRGLHLMASRKAFTARSFGVRAAEQCGPSICYGYLEAVAELRCGVS